MCVQNIIFIMKDGYECFRNKWNFGFPKNSENFYIWSYRLISEKFDTKMYFLWIENEDPHKNLPQ